MICNSANSYNKLQFKVHTCTLMQSLGGIEYLIVGEKGTNLSFEHLEFKNVATPLWPSVGVKPNTSKVGDLESSETLECLGFDSKARNTSH